MISFSCSCGQPIFFHDLRCAGCGTEVAYDPREMRLAPVVPRPGGVWSFRGDDRRNAPTFRLCAHRGAAAACNWMLDADDSDSMCRSCRTTRGIPDLGRPRNARRLQELEAAKRRVLFNVQSLGLPIVPRTAEPQHGLAFDFLETIDGSPPVMTGHASGVITINVAEVDDDYRERNREAFAEPYRTVVGHLRHELGHYYWDIIIWGQRWLEPFRALFGDERADYGAALRRHYNEGPPADWRERFISSYASTHPWEDWAETWAHYLHLRSTLETVASYKLDTTAVDFRVKPFGPEVLYEREPVAAGEAFLAWVNAWVVLVTVLNETARSMGQPDIYPFVLNAPVVTKLHFVHCAVHGERVHDTPPPPETLQVPGQALGRNSNPA